MQIYVFPRAIRDGNEKNTEKTRDLNEIQYCNRCDFG